MGTNPTATLPPETTTDTVTDIVTDFIIVIDSREQRGYQFPGAQVRKLDAGDYSVAGYESEIAIERKSLDDWVGTVLNARVRFRHELAKLRDYTFAAVLIEATPEDITQHYYSSNIAPEALMGITCELIVRLAPVVVLFGGDRPHSKLMCEKMLRFAARRAQERRELAAMVGATPEVTP